MSLLESFQGKRIIDLFNYFTSKRGRETFPHRWKAAFIKETIFSCTSGLEPLDPILFVDPLSDESEQREHVIPAKEDVDPLFVSAKYIEGDADTDREWVAVDDGESLNNIFDVLHDM